VNITQIIEKLGGTLRLTILSHLWLKGEMNPSELASELNLARSQISRELTELEKMKLIVRSKTQGNYVSVVLSNHGLDLWKEFFKKMGGN